MVRRHAWSHGVCTQRNNGSCEQTKCPRSHARVFSQEAQVEISTMYRRQQWGGRFLQILGNAWMYLDSQFGVSVKPTDSCGSRKSTSFPVIIIIIIIMMTPLTQPFRFSLCSIYCILYTRLCESSLCQCGLMLIEHEWFDDQDTIAWLCFPRKI